MNFDQTGAMFRLAHFALLFLALALIVSSHETRVRSPNAVKESHDVPPQWTRKGPAPPNHMINMYIGLKQTRMAALERYLYEVSDPASHRYGQHLSADEVHDLMKPCNDTSHFVHEWLADHGIDRSQLNYSPAKDWITVTLPVSKVERMLGTKYSVFEHKLDNHTLIRAPTWSLPQHLHRYIDVIQPTTSFLRRRSEFSSGMQTGNFPKPHSSDSLQNFRFKKGSPVKEVCNAKAITPLCLGELYGTLNYTPCCTKGDLIGMNNFHGESSNISDASLFLKQFRPDTYAEYKTGSFMKFQSIAKGENNQFQRTPDQLAIQRDQLGNLVAQTILGVSSLKPLTIYSTGGISPSYVPDMQYPNNMNEPYLEWLMYVLRQPSPPLVIATAYGDDEQTVPINYARRVCGDFMALGARGITLLFASGDHGVGKDPYCYTNDGKNKPSYSPQFPASCPYVTTVGATQGINPEIVANNPETGFASGGGFSKYFIRPEYQDTAVSQYLKSQGNRFLGQYNKHGRAYPDISAQGSNFVTIWNGRVILKEGTAASTATIAAIFALINDVRLRSNQKPLGFVNPLLYGLMNGSFNDVTKGSAVGCGTEGFEAAVGWDAVSGWGTPYFPKLCFIATGSKDCGYVP